MKRSFFYSYNKEIKTVFIVNANQKKSFNGGINSLVKGFSGE
jgi:hypothetical protein